MVEDCIIILQEIDLVCIRSVRQIYKHRFKPEAVLERKQVVYCVTVLRAHLFFVDTAA